MMIWYDNGKKGLVTLFGDLFFIPITFCSMDQRLLWWHIVFRIWLNLVRSMFNLSYFMVIIIRSSFKDRLQVRLFILFTMEVSHVCWVIHYECVCAECVCLCLSSESNMQEDLFEQILLGHLDFPSPYWDNITDSAKVRTAPPHTHTHTHVYIPLDNIALFPLISLSRNRNEASNSSNF